MVNETARRGEEKEYLVELVGGAKRLLSYLEISGDGLHPGLMGPIAQLKRILHENTEEHVVKQGRGEKVVVEERKGPCPDRLVSTVDPDARHGRKSADKKFVGYKAQVLESEAGFIVGVDGMKGNRHDTWKVAELVEELDLVGVRPSYLVGDGAYVDEELGIELERDGTKVVSPLKKRGEDQPFYNDCFEYIDDGKAPPRMRCPGGHETENCKEMWKGKVFQFTQCPSCQLRPQCTSKEYRAVATSRSYFYRKRKAAFNRTEKYKELMRERGKIERKNGQLKNWLGFRRCRYRGLAKFKLQCFFTALVANIQLFICILINAPPGASALGSVVVG
jgi:transposase